MRWTYKGDTHEIPCAYAGAIVCPRPCSDHINFDRRTGDRQREDLRLQQRQLYGDSDDQAVRAVQIHQDIRGGMTIEAGRRRADHQLSMVWGVCEGVQANGEICRNDDTTAFTAISAKTGCKSGSGKG